jgi:hypothetical protein
VECKDTGLLEDSKANGMKERLAIRQMIEFEILHYHDTRRHNEIFQFAAESERG